MLLAAVRPTTGRALLFGREANEPESRRRVGYLPENHRFPTYSTGSGMLDFYGALSGMNAADRARRIPELLELAGACELGRGAHQEIFERDVAAPWAGAGADASAADSNPG